MEEVHLGGIRFDDPSATSISATSIFKIQYELKILLVGMIFVVVIDVIPKLVAIADNLTALCPTFLTT